jgi:hypothetical protein
MLDYVGRCVDLSVDFKVLLKHNLLKNHEYELTRYNQLQDIFVITYSYNC